MKRMKWNKEPQEKSMKSLLKEITPVLKHIPDFVVLVDKKGTVVFVNHEGKNRRDMEAIIGSSVYDYLPTAEHGGMRTLLNAAFETKKIQFYEVENEHHDWYIVKIIPLPSDENHVVFVATDRTRLKRTQDFLKESRELLKTVVSNIPVIMWAIDPDKRFRVFEGKGLEEFGIDTKKWIGKKVTDFYRVVAPHKVPIVDKNLDRALSGERFSVIAEAFGGVFELHYIPLFDFHRRVTSIIGVANNISSFVQKEEELRKAKLQAEASNRAKSEFLANMSHEIRTPMSAILGFAEILADPENDSSKKDLCIGIIQKNSKHLLRLIDDILDFSKIEAGHLEFEKAKVNFREEMKSIILGHNPMSVKKGLDLSLYFDPDVPSVIRSDKTRLRQAVSNLIGNSIKFTEKGTVTVRIKMITQPGHAGEDKIAIYVSDTGIGIDQKYVGKLFRLFEQIDTSLTRKYGGAGLGLALSRKIARVLGGDLELLQTAVGEGTTFVLTIDPGVPVDKKMSEPMLAASLSSGTPDGKSYDLF